MLFLLLTRVNVLDLHLTKVRTFFPHKHEGVLGCLTCLYLSLEELLYNISNTIDQKSLKQSAINIAALKSLTKSTTINDISRLQLQA